jgi:hypothetical protein
MATYKEMIDMIGKFKHVPEILANPDLAYRGDNTRYNHGGRHPKYDGGGVSDPFTQGFTSGGFDSGGGGYNPYSMNMGEGSMLSGAEAGLSGDMPDADLLSGPSSGPGYQGLTPYGGGSIMAHSLINPRVSSFANGGKLEKKSEVTTSKDFKFTKFSDLTKEQQESLLTHFGNTEGWEPNGHIVTGESGITFGSGIDVKAVTSKKDLINHGISESDADKILKGLKVKVGDKTYDMAGKSVDDILKATGWSEKQLETHVKGITFESTSQSDVVSASVDKHYNNNTDLFDKVSNFEDFTVLSSVVHFTGDSHYEGEDRSIDRNKNASTKRALQVTIADLMNKHDGQLSSEQFHNVIYQADKIVDDQGGIGVRTDVSHPGDESATFNRWNKELNYSLGTLGEDYEHDETKYYTIDVDDLGKQGSSDKKSLIYYDATYVEPEVLPTEGMNMTPTQDISVQETPDPNSTPSESIVENPYTGPEFELENIPTQSFSKGGKFNTGGTTLIGPKEKEKTEYSKSAGSRNRGAFPRMKNEDILNGNVNESTFLALSMAQYYGYTGEINMTSGQRGGKDQTRVYGIYQREDAGVYRRFPEYQQAIADSLGVSLRDYKRNNVSSEEWENQDVDEVSGWIDDIWAKVQSGEMKMEEAGKLYPMHHMEGAAGDFTGSFKRWLEDGKSGKNKEAAKFLKDFDVDVLDESDHFHVTFGQNIDIESLPEEHQADYLTHKNQFDQLAIDSPDVAGTKVINMNPLSYQGEQRGVLTNNQESIEVQTPTLGTDRLPTTLPEKSLSSGFEAYQEYRDEATKKQQKTIQYQTHERLGIMDKYNPTNPILSYDEWLNENPEFQEQESTEGSESTRVGDHGAPFNESEDQPIDNILNPPGLIEGNFSRGHNPYNPYNPDPGFLIPPSNNPNPDPGFIVPPGNNPNPDPGFIMTADPQKWWYEFQSGVNNKVNDINNMINPYNK